jgi:hypothetical protein
MKLYAGVSANVMEILQGFAEKSGILKRCPVYSRSRIRCSSRKITYLFPEVI